MRVLVFGASGFIGLPVCQALVRAGHDVIGQTRSASNVTTFEKEEIQALVVDTNTDHSWTSLVPTLDAIIDASGGDNIKEASMAKFEQAERAAKERRDGSAAKLTYIWTSGTWIQGKSQFERRSDGAAITTAPALTAWRPSVEEPIRSSTVVNGVIIRPSLVYGRSGSIVAMLFAQAATSGEIRWPGARGSTVATIHVDDLAECYRLATEKAAIVGGNVIDCSNAAQESVELLLFNLATLAKVPLDKVSLHKPTNPFEQALDTSSPLHPVLARSLLGWQALKPSLNDGLPQYFRAFKAHANL